MKYKIEFEGMCPANYPDTQCNVVDQLCPGRGKNGCPAVKVSKCNWEDAIVEKVYIVETDCGRGFAKHKYIDVPQYCPYCGREVEIIK